MMQPTYFVIALLLMANTVQCNGTAVCGRHLGGVISYLCTNVYSSIEEPPPDIKTLEGKELWPWIARRFSYAMSSRARSKRIATIAEACCSKPCDIKELMSSC